MTLFLADLGIWEGFPEGGHQIRLLILVVVLDIDGYYFTSRSAVRSTPGPPRNPGSRWMRVHSLR